MSALETQAAPVTGAPGSAGLQLPRLSSHGTVVQRAAPVPVRGRAAPGARVAVIFAGSTRQALADAAGQWSTSFPAFAVAGADRRFVWAQARIEGNRVVVWSDAVPEPVAIRYAWGNDPENASLFNVDGLSAAPFRTDSW